MQTNYGQERTADADVLLDSIARREATKRIRVHQARSLLWFLISTIGLLLSAIVAIPAVSTTAWDTWLINWQSNLLFYFSGASLFLCLLHGFRATFLDGMAKRPRPGKRQE